LRAELQDILPDYMIPSSFTFLASMPLNAADKIDRKALPKPDISHALASYVAPTTATEKVLCQIWQDLLGLERVGLNDNFFELGGHSLLTLTLIEKMKQQSLYVDVAVLFMSPTLVKVAAQTSSQSNEIDVPANLLSSLFVDGSAEMNNEGDLDFEDYEFDEEYEDYEIDSEDENNKSFEEVS
jgi:arthrofactin-type cyclic lipopeptide synthetase B